MRTRTTLSGFSLIEVMIALAILAVAISGVMGHFVTVDRARDFSEQQSRGQSIAQAILNRISGENLQYLGDSANARAGWSKARYKDLADTPLTDNGTAVGSNSLQEVGKEILGAPSRLANLKVYIEYYRGQQSVDPSTGSAALLPGVMDDVSNTSVAAFQANFNYPIWRGGRRLTASPLPYLQVPVDTCVVIRILVLWGPIQANGEPSQKIELFSAKRRTS